MNPVPALDPIGPRYRIDLFEIPAESFAPFMHRADWIQRYVGGLAGRGRNLVLAQASGPGRFKVVTLVEWADGCKLLEAQALTLAHYRMEGFNPAEFLARLGVRADGGVYAPVATS